MGIIILVYPSFSEALSKLSTQWVKNPCQCEYTMFVYGRKPYLYHIIRQTTFHTSLKYVVLYILYYTLEPNFATSLLQNAMYFVCLQSCTFIQRSYTLYTLKHIFGVYRHPTAIPYIDIHLCCIFQACSVIR